MARARVASGPDECVVHVILLGDAGSGKTTLDLRFTQDRVTALKTRLCADFHTRLLPLGSYGQHAKVCVWDTAGQERFASLGPHYFRQAQGVVLAFDVCTAATFDALPGWLEQAQQQCDPNTPCILVGCKADKAADFREVDIERAEAFAAEHALEYVETSAVDGVNVDAAFARLVAMVIEERACAVPDAARPGGVRLPAAGALPRHVESREGCSC